MGFYVTVKPSQRWKVGHAVYHKALDDRRGFRSDQIGIPADDDVWDEIFEAIGAEAIAAVQSTLDI